MGNVHRFADQPPCPLREILGVAAAAASLAAAAGRAALSVAAAAAFLLLAGWLVLYLRISAPVTRALTEGSAGNGSTPGVSGAFWASTGAFEPIKSDRPLPDQTTAQARGRLAP